MVGRENRRGRLSEWAWLVKQGVTVCVEVLLHGLLVLGGTHVQHVVAPWGTDSKTTQTEKI